MVVQVVSSKFRKYQMEIIPESCYLLSQTSETSKGRKQGSYWKYAYRIAEIEHASERQEEESSLDHIENYWEKVLYQATRNWFLLFVTDLNFRGHILVLDREILENLERLYITEFHLWKLWQKLWEKPLFGQWCVSKLFPILTMLRDNQQKFRQAILCVRNIV